MSQKKAPLLALLMTITLGFMVISAPGILASNSKHCIGNELVTDDDVRIGDVWLPISYNETCANGCYDDMGYLGAGCAPVSFDLAIIAFALIFMVIAGFLIIRWGT